MKRRPRSSRDTMQILAVSDIHRNMRQMRWISAQSFDLLLIGGDLLDHGDGQHDVSNWIRSINRPVAISSGNHDGMLEGCDWMYDLRGPGRLIDEVGWLNGLPICALPWRYNDGDWIENSAQRCRRAAKMADIWVLLAHHIPPDDYQGNKDRVRVLDFETQLTPLIAVTGHLHHRPSISGGKVNPGQNDCQEPNHVWFDLRRRKGILNVIHQRSRDIYAFTF